MGSSLSQVLSSGSMPGSAHPRVSDNTKKCIRTLFEALIANPRNTAARLEGILCQIPKNENFLCVLDTQSYNLLQICVGLNNQDMVKWILSRGPDLNRGACSLPLHIACLRGLDDLVELLLKNGARSDVEARMCWPGRHSQNCEERSKHVPPQNRDHHHHHGYHGNHHPLLNHHHSNNTHGHHIQNNLHHHQNSNSSCSSDKLQNALYYAIDGDHPSTLELLTQRTEEPWLPWGSQKRPLLHIACERGAWECVQYLVSERQDEINQCYDEYYPLHQAVLHDIKFVEKLLINGAMATVRTATQQLTTLHVLFLLGKKSADEIMLFAKLLVEHGCRELVNEPDSLGNTPLHALVVRYAIEESRMSCYGDYIPWSKWDMLHIVRWLMKEGGRVSINQQGNSALACVLRHVRDWEFRYELISMLLAEGGNPNIAGRDGSSPLMVCLVPLINKDLLHNFTHNQKVFYLNIIRVLLKHGANPNCQSRSNLTPLHILMFAASEYMGLTQSEEKDASFVFIHQLLIILLQHGLDPNLKFSSRTQHILLSLLEMVNICRNPRDLRYIYDLSSTLISYRANPNVNINLGGDVICHSQSSFFLKKSSCKVLYYYVQWLCRREFLLLDEEKNFVKLLNLYVMCMEHRELYSTLRLIYTQSAIVPVRTALCSTIKRYYSNPRSLQQQCRLVIYKRLNYCPGLYASKLPLPSLLQKYVAGFE